MRANVAVKIGAGQNNDERELRMRFVKAADRFVAAPGVERDQQVAARTLVRLVQGDLMLELSQDAHPPDGGNFVAVVKTQGCGRNELYVHVV